MKLRSKLILYLIAVHIVFLATSYFVFKENRLWLLTIEGFFVLSFIVGFILIRSMLKPVDLVITGTELIEEEDFTSTFRKTGQPELDRLFSLYNEMIKKLRSERLALEEQHLFLHKLIQATPSGIVILDYDGAIEQVNPRAATLLETTNENLVGKLMQELHTPLTDAIDELGDEESKVVAFKGNRRIRCTKSQFIDKGFQRYFVLMEELTKEIRQSEKSAYEKLIRLLSHEVSNSVGAVSSLLQSCIYYINQIRDTDREDFENAVKVSISRLGNLNEFMKGYADIVRLPDPTLRACNVLDLIQNCEELFRRESEEKQIAWQWQIQEEIPPILLDKNQIEQVFVNVIKNAMDAIGTDGTITIRAGNGGNKYFLVIEDTGSGISEEARKNLFTPFFSTKDYGQGIGLTLVQEILNKHNFEFSLESKPGGSTQFTIWF
ncbi:MAG: PAS domain-containing protein [Deltaproteobacteria bacterium]|jgi:nitrogen fixation/metabolism regulation signal transduction histidine kinase|nr:PAS domain-containing protein [Deltaproteobacteria bacterium]